MTKQSNAFVTLLFAGYYDITSLKKRTCTLYGNRIFRGDVFSYQESIFIGFIIWQMEDWHYGKQSINLYINLFISDICVSLMVSDRK